jgi:hypothetical protein
MGEDVNAICSFAHKSLSHGSTPKLEQPDAKVMATKTSEYLNLLFIFKTS